MSSLKEIKNRIRSVKNTQKITSAMKMVAASKLRRAQESMEQARPYAHEIGVMLNRVADAEKASGATPSPLLDVRVPKKVMLVVMSSDRGLCGGFNSNILRRSERFIRENQDRFDSLEVATIGKKASEHFARQKIVTQRAFDGVFEDLNFRRASEIADGLATEYMGGDLDAIYLIYNKFVSVIAQEVTVQELLPISSDELPGDSSIEYIYEPGQKDVLDALAPRYVATQVWRSLLESSASEHGARMSAMDAASRNASDLIDSLTLHYNRARQAAITSELMDIVGGAEALNG